MIQLDTIVLPPGLWWEDEFSWTPVSQESSYSLEGALILDAGTKQAGRPITLVGTERTSWILRPKMLELQALAANPGLEMTLTLDSRSFAVMFRYSDGAPVHGVPLQRLSPPQDTHYYHSVAIRLMEI